MSKAEREMRKEEQEEQFERQMHGQNVGQAAAMQEEEGMEDLLELLGSTQLSEGSKDLLRNLVTKDIIFANYSSDDIERIRFELQVKRMQYHDMHPNKDCLLTGRLRAYANDDPTDRLQPIDPRESTIVDNFFEGAFARFTDAEGMKLLEKANENINVSKVQKDEKDNSGGGIFDRLG